MNTFLCDGILLLAFYGLQITIWLRAPANKLWRFSCALPTVMFANPCCVALDSDRINKWITEYKKKNAPSHSYTHAQYSPPSRRYTHAQYSPPCLSLNSRSYSLYALACDKRIVWMTRYCPCPGVRRFGANPNVTLYPLATALGSLIVFHHFTWTWGCALYN